MTLRHTFNLAVAQPACATGASVAVLRAAGLIIPHCILPQLTERRKGNAAYHQRDFTEALEHYNRARAVVDFVKGMSAADQVGACGSRRNLEAAVAPT